MATPAPSATPDPTKDLIRAARQGDRGAWEKLHTRHRKQLAILMRGRIPAQTRARFDTEDLVQSAFLSAFEELDQYEDQGEGSFKAWITTILMNRLRDRLSGAEADKRTSQRESPQDASQVPDPTDTPSELLVGAENQTLLVEALADLPDDLRQVLMLNRFDGLTFEQIGERLELPSSTVGGRVARAMRLLEERLRTRG